MAGLQVQHENADVFLDDPHLCQGNTGPRMKYPGMSSSKSSDQKENSER